MTVTERRRRDQGTMVRARILLGLIAVMHGIGGLYFDHEAGISYLVRMQTAGWLFCAGLIGFGGLMVIAAIGERRGFTKRWCRDFSVSMLGATWIAVFVHSFEGGADQLTLMSPLYFTFCVWAWLADAGAHRANQLAQKQERIAP